VGTAQVSSRGGKYLTFQLSRQYFAVRSESVRHILPAGGVHVVPDRLPALYGFIPSSGRMIPVLDIRQQFGLEARPIPSGASVLVLSLDVHCPLSLVGLLADKLSEVVEFRAIEIRASVAQLRIEGRPYGRPKTLLQLEELLPPDYWAELRSLVLE
jgi:purine-binding chemotaxis protein CheW